jgi:hypothetical protein
VLLTLVALGLDAAAVVGFLAEMSWLSNDHYPYWSVTLGGPLLAAFAALIVSIHAAGQAHTHRAFHRRTTIERLTQ